MKKLTILLTVVFLSMLFIMPAHPGLKKVAQTGLQFLKVDVNPRAVAMGGAFTMIGNDASALFYNPAGIAAMRSNFDVFASRTQWIADISLNAGAVMMNLGTLGSVGISFVSTDYGDIIGTRVAATEQGYEETGLVDVSEYAVGFAYARQMTDKFTMGGQIKYASQNLGESLIPKGEVTETITNKVTGLAYDFGTIFYPGFRSLRMGMDIRNFSPQFKYQETAFELPLTFSIGMAMNIFDFMPSLQETQSLVVAVDAIHPRDYTERLHVGGEYWYMDMLALRAGYKFNYDEESLSAGIGIKYLIEGEYGIKIDYSYSEMAIFDAVNRFSIGVTF